MATNAGDAGYLPTGELPITGDEADAKVAEVSDLVSQLHTEFLRRDYLYERIDEVLFQQIPVSIPDAYRKTAVEVHSPLALQIANTVTSALTINPPTVHFEPTGFGTSYQENATLREQFFEASWRRQQEDARRRLFRVFMFSLISKGEAILKTIERSKVAWSDYDAFAARLREDLAVQDLPQHEKDRKYNQQTEDYKKSQPYPIVTTFVHPKTFRYIASEEGLSFVAEVKEIPIFDAMDKFGLAPDGKGRLVPVYEGLPRPYWNRSFGKQRTITCVEAWDCEQVCYILAQGTTSSGGINGGQLVRRFAHGYGDPITHTLRGPYFQALGPTTDSPFAEMQAVGLLTPYLDLFPYLDSLLTIQSNSAYMTGFATYKRVGPPSSQLGAVAYGLDNSEQPTKIIPGEVLPFDVEPINQPQSGADLKEALAIVQQFLEKALPPAVQGIFAGDESGYAFNQAQHLASMTWDPFVDNAQTALSMRTGFESWLIENAIGETVYVWSGQQRQRGRILSPTRSGYLGIGPDDLNGVHRYSVNLDPSTPSNQVIEVRTHEAMLRLRLETYDQAVEAMGNSPSEVEQAWLLYDLKNSPTIKGLLEQRVLSELNSVDQGKLGGTQAAIAAVQGPQMGGVGQILTPPGPQGLPGPYGPPGAPPGALPAGNVGGPAAQALGNVGAVVAPGMGMPLQPTPPGAVTGGGPLAGGPLPPPPSGPATRLRPPGRRMQAGPRGPTGGMPGGIPNVPPGAQGTGR